MKQRYIPIDSVDDIDVSKIGLGNINNRYIDKNGRRYATRFNLRTRKIEIVPIALGIEEARLIKKGLLGNTGNKQEQKQNIENPYNLPEWALKEGIQLDVSVNPIAYVPQILNNSKRFGERIRGIISGMKKTGAFEERTQDGHDVILDLTTFYDREIQPFLHETENQYTEFIQYPKAPENYFTSLGRKEKMFVEKLDPDEQMAFYQAYFLGNAFLTALRNGLELIHKVEEEMAKVNPASLNYDKKQAYEDTKASCEFVADTIREEAGKIFAWQKKAKVLEVE
ncbi:MAG: hypothetical protein D6767_05395 [Candidatus Hydrogenedentota bacterium]|nr:MAG: hypothetical protein D6767_05395 [Candidatus Hydrogenedentota bacterium]